MLDPRGYEKIEYIDIYIPLWNLRECGASLGSRGRPVGEQVLDLYLRIGTGGFVMQMESGRFWQAHSLFLWRGRPQLVTPSKGSHIFKRPAREAAS